MILTRRIGGSKYVATVGAHEGSDNPQNYIRVEGPGLNSPAEYLRDPNSSCPEQEGADAIRYTIDNIIFPLALAAVRRGERSMTT